MANETFFNRFHGVIILCCLSGIYIPGAERLFPFKSRSLIFGYLTFFYVAGWFNFVDNIVILTRHKLSFGLTFQLVSTMGMLCWVILTSMFMLTQGKNLSEMIRLWDEELQPKLFQEKRDSILNVQTKLLWRKIQTFAIVQTLPLFLFFFHAMWAGQLMVASSLGTGTQREASSLAVLPQVLSFSVWITTYPSYQCLFTLVLRLILADLEYLKLTLENILCELTVNCNGSIQQGEISDSDENWTMTYQKSCENLQVKLNTVVKHHVNVLKFGNIAKKIYQPVVFAEFFTLSTFVSCFVYCATEGIMDKDIAILVIINMSLYCFMTSLHCAIGDDIRMQSFGLGEAAFYGNWMAYPIKIQKMMIMIIRISYQRPIMIQPFGMFPLILNTYRKMTYLQYRFFRCLSDIKRH